MTVGALLQYKENYYGRYHPKLPKIPFATHNFLASTHQCSWDAYALMQSGQHTVLPEVVRKKFVLFCAQVVYVAHPKTPLIGCNYLKCFISDPYVNGETIDGWIQEKWVEPLNEISTYQEEHKQIVRNLYLAMSKGEKTPSQMREIFRELQRAKNE
jgi:hypothetical protein